MLLFEVELLTITLTAARSRGSDSKKSNLVGLAFGDESVRHLYLSLLCVYLILIVEETHTKHCWSFGNVDLRHGFGCLIWLQNVWLAVMEFRRCHSVDELCLYESSQRCVMRCKSKKNEIIVRYLVSSLVSEALLMLMVVDRRFYIVADVAWA